MDENYFVEDSEELYRNVKPRLQWVEYSYDNSNRLIIQPGAFHDPHKQPSVDRAKLLGLNPSCALLNKENGIVSLAVSDVRKIGDVVTSTEVRTVVHAVEIKFLPKPTRPAHSHIIVEPEFFGSKSKQNKVFKFLRKALARIATKNGWTLKPQ